MYSYIIYSGFTDYTWYERYANKHSQDFFAIWYRNTRKASDHQIRIFGPDVPNIDSTENVKVIAQYNNLGPVGDYMSSTRQGRWCGWTAGVIYGMIDAYTQNADFLYKEQDCLAFGNYINQAYKDLGDADIVYGNNKAFGAAQSLFLVKRNSIPAIISALGLEDDGQIFPENKFTRLPVKQNRLSFGYDRDRPFDVNDSCFYIQQPSIQDFELLEQKGLI